MRSSIFRTASLAIVATLVCVGCNNSGDNDDTNGEADAFLRWVNKTTYTITFDGNVKGAEVTTVTADYGTEITLKDPIRLNGYLFLGWNTGSDGMKTGYGAGERYAVTDNITFYAMWIYIDMVRIEGDTSMSDFDIGRYEVTQKLWEAVMGNNPSYFTDNDSLPVERVSWDEVQEFISALNEKTEEDYRLPTAAEWEFAARDGGGGDGNIDVDDVAWHVGNSDGKTHIVGTKQPNALEIYDMFGNVREWVNDKFRELEKDPEYLIYGGSWSEDVDIYSRSYGTRGYRDDDLGFRLAK